MRRIISLLTVLLIAQGAFAQNLTPTFKFVSGTDEDLRQQFTSLLYQEGCAVDTLSGVLLQIRMTPVRQGMIDGMKRLHTAAFNLYVETRLSGSQKVVSSEVAQIQSTGNTPELAERAAILQLQNGSTRLSRLIQKLSADYQKTFGGPCHELLAEAAKLANNDQLIPAIALTNAVPASADCYVFASRQRSTYYTRYQEEFCRAHISAAQTHLALEKPQAAVEELSKIDPESSCAEDARVLVERAASLLKEQQSAKARFLRQVYQNQVQVEQARNQIISDLVKE